MARRGEQSVGAATSLTRRGTDPPELDPAPGARLKPRPAIGALRSRARRNGRIGLRCDVVQSAGRPAVTRRMLVRVQPSQFRVGNPWFPPAVIARVTVSTRPGLLADRGCRPLKPATRVRIPLGASRYFSFSFVVSSPWGSGIVRAVPVAAGRPAPGRPCGDREEGAGGGTRGSPTSELSGASGDAAWLSPG